MAIEELAVPCYVLKDAGVEMAVAFPKGGGATLER